MTKHTFPFLSIIAVLMFSCSSIKLKNATQNLTQKLNIESVNFIAENEKISHSGKRIGEFVLREDLKNDWPSIKRKMSEFAKQNGANLIEVKTFGWGKKGNGFYADGFLYYVENINQVVSPDSGCSIFITRNNMENFMGSTFPIDIKINESVYNDLSKQNFIKKDFSDCHQTATISINREIQKVNLNGKSKYFQISKEASGNLIGGVVSIGVGGISFVEIKDEELARLIMYSN